MSAFEKLLFLLLRNRGRRFGIAYGFGCLLSLSYVAEVQTVFCRVGVNIHHSHAGCEEKCCCNGGRAAEEVGVAGRAEYALRAAASRSEVAPASAPLPCWSNTNTMTAKAEIILIIQIRVLKASIFFYAFCAALMMAVKESYDNDAPPTSAPST